MTGTTRRPGVFQSVRELVAVVLLLVWSWATVLGIFLTVFWASGHVADETFAWAGVVYAVVTLAAFLAAVDDGGGQP